MRPVVTLAAAALLGGALLVSCSILSGVLRPTAQQRAGTAPAAGTAAPRKTPGAPGAGKEAAAAPAPTKPPAVRWKFTTAGAVQQRLVEAGALVLAVGQLETGENAYRSTLHAVQTTGGREAWRLEAGGPALSAPAYAGGRVLWGAGDGTLYVLDGRTGRVVKRVEAGAGRGVPISALAADRDTAWLGFLDGGVAAVALPGGAVRWRFRAGAAVLSGPTVDGDQLLFGSHDGGLYALDRKSGKLRWRFAAGGYVLAPPVVAGGRVLGGSFDGQIFALDRASGEPAWSVQVPPPAALAPLAAGGQAYWPAEDGLLMIDLASGKTLRRFGAGGTVAASPRLAAGRLLVVTGWGVLYALDPATLKPAWSLKLGGYPSTPPLAAGGQILVGSTEGQLTAWR